MRALYSLAEMPGLLDHGKNIAIIGDGPSKLKYLYNRRNVYTFGINRAAIDYPCDFAVCMAIHLDIILGILPQYVPLIYINNFDMVDLKIDKGGTWTAPLFFRWLISWVSSQRVYLQGFDFTEDVKRLDGQDQGYALQGDQFKYAVDQFPRRDVVKVSANKLLDIFPTAAPNPADIL